MPALAFTARALHDLVRLSDFLLESEPSAAGETGKLIIDGLRILNSHPLIGRPVRSGLRELPISRGRTGYIALYKFDPLLDKVWVLSVRHQREVNSP